MAILLCHVNFSKELLGEHRLQVILDCLHGGHALADLDLLSAGTN